MALILNLETATKTCSVVLSMDEEVIAIQEITTEKFSHAEKLNLFIEKVLTDAGKSFKDLDAVAVSAGPGSYTGLRIGASTAKGICFALDIPLISVNSLKALASQAKIENGLLCPMFDARRMEVYMAIYNSALKEIKPTSASVVESIHSFKIDLDKGPIYFFGPGAVKCQDIIVHENAIFDLDVKVSAKGMAILSFQKFKDKEFEDVAYFEPAYLKDFIAGPPKKMI
jgi:tRNA threonylcarbamoyladenosine biosynthesis protein TsaB